MVDIFSYEWASKSPRVNILVEWSWSKIEEDSPQFSPMCWCLRGGLAMLQCRLEFEGSAPSACGCDFYFEGIEP